MVAEKSSPSSKDARNINSRIAGIANSINSFRLEVELPKESYSQLKPKIAEAIRTRKFLCPLCLKLTESFWSIRKERDFVKYSTHPVCRSWFKQRIAGLPASVVKLQEA